MPARRQQTLTPCRVRAILPAAVTSHAFPPNNFKHFLTLFSKFFSSFPHGTCSLSVSHQYLALDGIYHPLFAAFPNNKTRRRHFVQQADRHRRGSHPLGRPFPGNLGTGACRSHLDRPQFSGASTEDFRLGLFPVRSPLLGESWLVSFPPLIDMLKFSGCSCLNSGRMVGGAFRSQGPLAVRVISPEGRRLATTTGADRSTGPLAFQPVRLGKRRGQLLRGQGRTLFGEGVGTTLRQACPRPRLQAPYAFKDSMIHGILQFTSGIAFRCVLHRCGSRDIRC